MSEWWSSMPGFEKLFWYFAVPFTLVFVIRLIASLLGLGGGEEEDLDAPDSGGFEDGDGDSDGGGDGSRFLADFRLFTLQNFIIFFTGFGWAGIFAASAGFSPPLTVLFAFVVGIFLMLAVAGMYYLINRLAESGNINLSNAVHSTGRVYIPIPAERAGTGQIQITIQGSLREVESVTDGEALPTGTPVKVIAVVNEAILVVEKIR